MSADVTRVLSLTVLNGGTDSAAVDVHQAWADATIVILFSPASLNIGVFIIQVTPDDILSSPTWYTSPAVVPAAGAAGSITSAIPVIGMRIHATTPPNADTIFRISKQYMMFGAAA